MQTVKTEKGREVNVLRLQNDINGNPRYVVSWLALGLKKYESNNKTRAAGLRKHKSKSFGGGFSFQSYNLRTHLDFIIDTCAK